MSVIPDLFEIFFHAGEHWCFNPLLMWYFFVWQLFFGKQISLKHSNSHILNTCSKHTPIIQTE